MERKERVEWSRAWQAAWNVVRSLVLSASAGGEWDYHGRGYNAPRGRHGKQLGGRSHKEWVGVVEPDGVFYFPAFTKSTPTLSTRKQGRWGSGSGDPGRTNSRAGDLGRNFSCREPLSSPPGPGGQLNGSEPDRRHHHAASAAVFCGAAGWQWVGM
eukprot:760865-Hanusia_phi.AAC.1